MEVETLIGQWGFLGVIAAAILEEIAFVIPSSLVHLGAGFIVMNDVPVTLGSFGALLLFVSLPIAIGTVLGSFFLYAVGYWLGKPFIDRFGTYLGVSWASVEKVVEYARSKKSDELLLFVARLTPIIPNTPLGIACGAIRYPLWRYTLISFVGIFLRATLVGYIGWRVGAAYAGYAERIEAYKYHGLALLAAAVGVFVWYALKRRRKRV